MITRRRACFRPNRALADVERGNAADLPLGFVLKWVGETRVAGVARDEMDTQRVELRPILHQPFRISIRSPRSKSHATPVHPTLPPKQGKSPCPSAFAGIKIRSRVRPMSIGPGARRCTTDPC